MENTTNTKTTNTKTTNTKTTNEATTTATATKTTAGIYTDTQATATIERIAEANPKAVSKDIDALLEMGEVDCETVWTGYLWEAVAEEVGYVDEDTEMLLSSAIVDFYCDQMEGMYDEDEEEYEEEEEDLDPITLYIVAEWYEYTESEIPLTDVLRADLQIAYDKLVAGGYTMEDAIREAVYIVADAQ